MAIEDAITAAQREAEHAPATVEYGGRQWRVIPTRVGLKLVNALERLGNIGTLEVLFGKEQTAELIEMDVANEDVVTLIGDAMKIVTGRGLGEASASPNSSANGGMRQRPTSNAGTESTSPTPVSATTPLA